MLTQQLTDPSARAEHFAGSTDPMILLAIPGCVPVAQNQAHAREFAPSEPVAKQHEEKLPVIAQPDDYLRTVDREKQRIARQEMPKMRCYCDVRDAVLALRAEDCVFEYFFALFERFKSQQSHALRGLEFLLEPNATGDSTERRYSIWRVHSRLVATEAGGVNGTARGLIEARLVRAKDMHLVVAGTDKESLSASVWRNHGTADARRLVTVETVRTVETLTVYNLFENDLESSLAEGVNPLEVLKLAAARREPDPFLYPAVTSINERLSVIPDPDEVREQVQLLHRRLWDGPLAATPIRPVLEKFLAENPDEVPGRLRWSLSQLEAADIYAPV